MALQREPETPGWYRVMSLPSRPLRYWDGEEWFDLEEPDESLPSSSEVFRHERNTAAERAIGRTGARAGEGIPFHELYLRRTSKKKHNW